MRMPLRLSQLLSGKPTDPTVDQCTDCCSNTNMFPSVPPIVRVALRHRKALGVGAGLVAILVLLYHQSSLPDSPQQVSVVQVDPKGFPRFSENQTGGDISTPQLLLNPSAVITPGSPLFLPGSPRPLGAAYTKAVVIARTKSEEVTWASTPLDTDGGGGAVVEDWAMYMYTTDDLGAAGLHTPLNKGREAMAYLTYMVDRYADLPDISVFMHAHLSSWHDNMFALDAVQTLRRLNLDRVVRLGFMNLRCGWDPGCPDHIHPRNTEYDAFKPEQAVFAAAWAGIFPLDDLPDTLSQPCCAQFALTADRIRAWPQSRYIALRDWILTTELDDSISGRVFEYIYQNALRHLDRRGNPMPRRARVLLRRLRRVFRRQRPVRRIHGPEKPPVCAPQAGRRLCQRRVQRLQRRRRVSPREPARERRDARRRGAC
ncbi:hypothetical protein B0T26DRAFT_165583 [Lasiosphaeria miniovina]|uniref:Uncharacterized protein n=1 Tax=Lasiosphaeria miniovina TaxID=1954250 RepID=A0AA40E5X4_9PEZI|nr:uncharacterized protein B0T26DRAFT_165583 [Lasiosphaeria miniovina]KAK0728255.1 hypothetical protein B0T26DRAFT_165583 [Lasiosphaeria miniovina]